MVRCAAVVVVAVEVVVVAVDHLEQQQQQQQQQRRRARTHAPEHDALLSVCHGLVDEEARVADALGGDERALRVHRRQDALQPC